MAAVIPGTTSNGMSWGPQEFYFLAAATEDERVPTLQAHDTTTRLRLLEHDLVDAALAYRVTAGLLADADAIRIATGEREHLGRDEPVVQDHVGFLQRTQGIQGEQPRIPGAGSDQHDRTKTWCVCMLQRARQFALGRVDIA